MMPNQLVTHDEAQEALGQHTRPCADCPWARKALPGWLGGLTADEWLAEAHGESVIECHTLLGAQCAGAAIYRRNVCKYPRPPNLALDVDRERCFANRDEFKAHHTPNRKPQP